MLKYDFEESIGYWLTLAHHAYINEVKNLLAPHGITFRQAEILAWLALEGPLSQADLASRMLIEPPSLVGTLDRMEASGLLQRRTSPDDRRKNLIHILPSAEGMWEQIAHCARQVRAQAIAGLTDKEVAALKTLLKKVRDNFVVMEPVESVS